MEKGHIIKIGEHGAVQFVDAMGNDKRIVDAARTSYGEGTKTVREDKGLIDYLIRNKHTSPIEQVEIATIVDAPIFVARQWFRHRTASANEVSARYSELPDKFWIPEKLRAQGNSHNRQVSNGELEEAVSKRCVRTIKALYESAYVSYENLLAQGVSKEEARSVLPVGIFTRFYWKQDLHNLLHLCRLRTDSHAQPEIQLYGNALLQIAESVAPMAVASWRNHIQQAITFSQDEFVWVQIVMAKGLTPDVEIQMEEDLGKGRVASFKERVERFIAATPLTQTSPLPNEEATA